MVHIMDIEETQEGGEHNKEDKEYRRVPLPLPNLTINLTAAMPTHLINTIHDILGEDLHDKKEERTNRRKHNVVATMKRIRSIEELPSPYQQNKQST